MRSAMSLGARRRRRGRGSGGVYGALGRVGALVVDRPPAADGRGRAAASRPSHAPSATVDDRRSGPAGRPSARSASSDERDGRRRSRSAPPRRPPGRRARRWRRRTPARRRSAMRGEHEQRCVEPAERRPAASSCVADERRRGVPTARTSRRRTRQRRASPAAPPPPAARGPLARAQPCSRAPAIRAACSVLRSRQAIVIGPTPPGTGVIAPATSPTASKSTSPTRPSSVRLMPTSMTVAPGLTQSPLTIRSRPTAAIRTSARRQTSAQVARARVADRDRRVGAEQQLGHRLAEEVRAADDDRLGALELRARPPRAAASRRSACTAAGPRARARAGPALTGVSPSTSLSASIRPVSSTPSRWSGTGSWQRIPLTSRVGVELLDQRRRPRSRGGVGRAGGGRSRACRPRRVAFCLPPT